MKDEGNTLKSYILSTCYSVILIELEFKTRLLLPLFVGEAAELYVPLFKAV